MREKLDRPAAGCNACYPSSSCPDACRERNDIPSRRAQLVPPRSSTPTLISALRILARDIQSGDGVANAAIAEAAERLEEVDRILQALLKELPYQECRNLHHAKPDQFHEGKCPVEARVNKAIFDAREAVK